MPTVVEVERVSAHIDYLNKNSSVILTSQMLKKSYDVNGDKMGLEAMKRSRGGKTRLFSTLLMTTMLDGANPYFRKSR